MAQVDSSRLVLRAMTPPVLPRMVRVDPRLSPCHSQFPKGTQQVGRGRVGALRDVPRTVWLLACGTFANMVVSVSFAYTFLYLTGPRGLDAGQAGLLSGIGGVGLVAGNFTGGWYGDRFGHRRVLLVAAVVSGSVLATVPLLPTPALFAALPVTQYASGVQRAANSALVAVIVPEGARRQAFRGGPGGGERGVHDRARAGGGGRDRAVVRLAVRGRRGGRCGVRLLDGPGGAGPGAGGTARCRTGRRRERWGVEGVAGTAGGGGALGGDPGGDVVYRQQYSTFPMFLGDHGLDARVYGALLAVNGGVLLCLELPAALALRRVPPLRVVGAGLLLVGAGYGVLLSGVGIGTAVVMMGLLTIGELLYKTTATAYVADQAPEHVRGGSSRCTPGCRSAGWCWPRRWAGRCTRRHRRVVAAVRGGGSAGGWCGPRGGNAAPCVGADLADGSGPGSPADGSGPGPYRRRGPCRRPGLDSLPPGTSSGRPGSDPSPGGPGVSRPRPTARPLRRTVRWFASVGPRRLGCPHDRHDCS
ncbi:hypothetical protein SALBM311S_11072 [Streptomyces alboniger]